MHGVDTRHVSFWLNHSWRIVDWTRPKSRHGIFVLSCHTNNACRHQLQTHSIISPFQYKRCNRPANRHVRILCRSVDRHHILFNLRQKTHSQSVRLLSNNPRRPPPLDALNPPYTLTRMLVFFFWLVIKLTPHV